MPYQDQLVKLDTTKAPLPPTLEFFLAPADHDSSGGESFISGTNFEWEEDSDGAMINSSSPLPNSKPTVE